MADAYGWLHDLSEDEILARLVALNHQRAEEERRSIIRRLRPEFENISGKKQTAIPIEVGQAPPDDPAAKPKSAKPTKQTWPKHLSEQAGAVHTILAALPAGASATDIAKSFGRATAQRVERIEEILETLAALGKAREIDNDRYLAV